MNRDFLNRNTITVTDNRSGKALEIPIDEGGTVGAPKFSPLGLRIWDPAYMNTAVARSKICEVDGDNGILRYAGYPIEQLAESSDHIEVAYLLAHGELPTKGQLESWRRGIVGNAGLPESVLNVIRATRKVR
jgi:citrate synthase